MLMSRLTLAVKTAENTYAGQAGLYIVTDPEEDALNLPSGYGVYDIPLVLNSKQYNADGTLSSLQGEIVSLWGDVIHVNDQPWPFLHVEPRKYRFRVLNAAVSRSFALYFVDTTNINSPIPFQIIASDSGLLERPVLANRVVSFHRIPRSYMNPLDGVLHLLDKIFDLLILVFLLFWFGPVRYQW